MKESSLAPRPRYHLISIAMPFLGLAAAIGFLSLTPDFGGLNHWPTMSKQDHRWISLAFWLLGIAGIVGLTTASRSIALKEKPGFLAILGVNAQHTTGDALAAEGG